MSFVNTETDFVHQGFEKFYISIKFPGDGGFQPLIYMLVLSAWM
jgi:hypothetical protein